MPQQAQPDPAFESLLEFLKRSRGFDFTGYKRSTLMRRVEKRMQTVGLDQWDAYHDYLEVHPEEFGELFNTILINVTSFFRDRDAWDTLARVHVPRLMEGRGPERPLRVWTAGCASGAETYTLVMVLAEALGVDGFRDRVKVYATDVDEEALAQARYATYAEKELEEVPRELRDRYFERNGHGWVFRNDLRRHVIFGRHDLVQDAPISHLDLLVCRNTLMYFNAEVQARIMARFHFALNPEGLLFLGKAEMMRSHAALFTPVDLKARIYGKVARPGLRERLMMLAPPRGDGAAPRAGLQVRLRDAALNAGHAAQVVVDLQGALVLANEPARHLFALGSADVGRPVQDLKLSYRPVELRSRIEQVTAERRPLVLPNVEFSTPEGEQRTFDVHVAPLLEDGQALLGVSVAFVDVTRSQRLQSELEQANQDLETAYEELQSTNEELETTNEELQSTVEELETTNEELQSTNEELETMNEELQSTNEELESINDELRRRTDELNDVNAYMSSILTSLRLGVVVLDHDVRIRVWNRKAEDLWGLRENEVHGQGLLNLDIGLPVERLKGPIRACLEGRSEQEEQVVDALNRRGRAIQVEVSASRLATPGDLLQGVILVMAEKKADNSGQAA
ncbi:MAG TPA: CheR family methyltransferase [Longimicrobium sp.]|nr:CheR family methyltransferase [Longimicrobium sp.]